ncbi:MAG TPA: ergothioneine biosynthesis protein EgtB [Solirubrobacteraceae bacterium]|nr:ergothioneine biosynthesis protein EgtB [Solirubrobacteraceae bacterium]
MLDVLEAERERTLALVAPLPAEQLEAQPDPIMSPLVWDLAHIAAYEDLWINHRHGRRPLLRPDVAAYYDAFETPRAVRGSIEILDAAAARGYLAEVRDRSAETIERRGGGELVELVLRHELQHRETMLQTLQLTRPPGYDPERPPLPERAPGPTGLERVEVPRGAFVLGAGNGAFAYDNERPAHRLELPAFAIGRAPVTNASFLSFVEGGGYERRTLWTEEAWQWKEQYDITHPMGWTGDGREWRMGRPVPLHATAPVVHVSWFEAAAFARFCGARLPTEAEWEKAATWDQETQATRPPAPEHANLDQTDFGPRPPVAESVSPAGCLAMLGDVWEWTSSAFGGYPAFRAHPYREYSEVFFGRGYHVLRGGSWATARRVATPTFRNWDLPQRRQIFAGVRLAWDA